MKMDKDLSLTLQGRTWRGYGLAKLSWERALKSDPAFSYRYKNPCVYRIYIYIYIHIYTQIHVDIFLGK